MGPSMSGFGVWFVEFTPGTPKPKQSLIWLEKGSPFGAPLVWCNHVFTHIILHPLIAYGSGIKS